MQLHGCAVRMSRGGTIRTWSSRLTPRITVPAITVCHGNRFKKSQVLRHTLPNTTWVDWRRRKFQTLNWTSFDGLDEFYERATYSWDDSVYRCWVQGKPCKAYGWLRSRITLIFGRCDSFHPNISVARRANNGQVLIFLLEKESLEEFEHNGWGVFLHPVDTNFSTLLYAVGLAQRIRVYKNHAHRVKVGRQTTVSRPDTTGCSLTHTTDTFRTCLTSCIFSRSRIFTENATCSVPWVSTAAYKHSTPSCASFSELQASGFNFYRRTSEIMFQNLTSGCNCKPSCNKEEYMLLQQEKSHLSETSVYLDVPTLRNMTAASLRILVSQEEVFLQEQDAYPMGQFVAEVGGSIGFMLGGSLLTLAHAIDLVAVSAWRWTRGILF